MARLQHDVVRVSWLEAQDAEVAVHVGHGFLGVVQGKAQAGGPHDGVPNGVLGDRLDLEITMITKSKR